MSSWHLFALSIVMVGGILITLNFDSMYDYYSYASVIEQSDIYLDGIHVDQIPLDLPAYPAAIKNITFLEEDCFIDVIFDDSDSDVMKNVPNFTYERNFVKGESFVFYCSYSDLGFTHFSLFEYGGSIQKDGETMLVMIGGEGNTRRHMTCDYPDVIEHSINKISLSSYLDQ